MLTLYKAIYLSLKNIKETSLSYEEGWGNIELRGEYDNSIFQKYRDIHTNLKKIRCEHLVKFWFDSDVVTVDEIEDYEFKPNSYYMSKLTFNKQGFIEKTFLSGCYYSFFLTSASCENWLLPLNPLDENNPVNKFSPLIIYITDISSVIGSNTLSLVPLDFNPITIPISESNKLPSIQSVKESIHFISDIRTSFDLNTYDLNDGDYSSMLGQALLKQSAIAMSIGVVDEFYSFNKVILNGLRRLSLSVYDGNDIYTFALIADLKKLIEWIYEDRVSTRKKLFNERLTLEISESKTLINSMQIYLKEALEQAKERYNFVILDRKDAYVKELKDLLKDLRAQSDLYSLKIRTLLNNFLRDLLATLVLIGFTIFTKFTDNIGLDKTQLLAYVFNGLACYFVLSIVFQSAVDVADLRITDKELTYWKKAAKELISEKEFNQHYKSSLSARKTSIYILYPIIGCLYLIIGYLCYKYPSVLENLLTK